MFDAEEEVCPSIVEPLNGDLFKVAVSVGMGSLPVGNAYYKMGGSPGVGTPNPTPPLDVPRENAWTGICHSRVRYSTIIQGPVGTA